MGVLENPTLHVDFAGDGATAADVTTNNRAKATDTYILKGDETEVYEPRFTFHGFRYVEVTGEPRLPEIVK